MKGSASFHRFEELVEVCPYRSAGCNSWWRSARLSPRQSVSGRPEVTRLAGMAGQGKSECCNLVGGEAKVDLTLEKRSPEGFVSGDTGDVGL